jgi:hypothetical protein
LPEVGLVIRVFLVAVAFTSGCGSPPQPKEPPPPPVKTQQLGELETIDTLQKDVAAFAESLPEIRHAHVLVRLRPPAAIVLLSPAENATIQRESIEWINALLKERAGLEEDQINMRILSRQTTGPKGGER